MRLVLFALLVLGGPLWAESGSGIVPPAQPRTRTLYPGGGSSYTPDTIASPDERVFDLPEMRQDAAQEYTKDGRPIVGQSQLNSERLAEIEGVCRETKDKGQMSEYRSCVKREKEKALAEIQSSFDRTNRTKEQPFRKSDSAPPLLEEQRKANKAFDAEENN